jgi:hypothetical protein
MLKSPYRKAKRAKLKSIKKKHPFKSDSYEWLRRHREQEEAED